jgi:2,4-diaminopentanoate dehydrogenase
VHRGDPSGAPRFALVDEGLTSAGNVVPRRARRLTSIATVAVPDSPSRPTPVRIAVYGTGRAGAEIVRAGMPRGDVEIVAAVVVDPAKDGRDLGELAGLTPIGVLATTDLASMLARSDVDAVVYCGIGDPISVAEILGTIADAGKDAVTVTGLVHPVCALGAERANSLAKRAQHSGARVVGAGLNPGFLVDVLPVVWGQACSRIDRLHALRVGEMKWWGRGIHDECGLGRPPEDAPERIALSLDESLAVIGDDLNLAFDRTEDLHEPYVTSVRREYAGRVVEPGTIAGFRKRAIGYRDRRPLVEIEWRAIFCIDPEVDGVDQTVQLRIEGDTTIEARASGSFFGDSYPATAARALASVLALRGLPPGVYRPDQLPVARWESRAEDFNPILQPKESQDG